MRIIFLLTLAAFLSLSITSCQKNNAAPDTLAVIWNLDSLMPTSPFVLFSPSFCNAKAVLLACKISGIVTDTAGDTTIYNRNWQTAYFNYDSTGIIAASVNSTPLNINRYYSFFTHYDNGTTWNESGTNHWSLSASGNLPSVSADVPGSFPSFSGTLPVVVSTTTDFNLTFNSGNTYNADSAYVIIWFSDSSSSILWYSNVVSTNNGTATISKKHLGFADNMYMSVPGIGGHMYYGGQIVLVLYNHSIQPFGGKPIAFVNQREYFGIVHFQ